MSKNSLPPQDVLHNLLNYDPETGSLTWKPRPVKMFSSCGACKSWNSRYAGKCAFNGQNSWGYADGKILGKTVAKHQIIFKYVHGYEPKYIDHINGDIRNNRISNLRPASASGNGKNRFLNKNNTSGVTGVYQRKINGRWSAEIKSEGKRIHLGDFATKEAACLARKSAEAEYDFSHRHGSERPA